MPTPQDRRLQADYNKLQKLAAESGGTLRIIQTSGVPPVQYIIEYKCPGLARDAAGRINKRYEHRIQIDLGLAYPIEKPAARMLTPAFNPHVFTTGAVCLGSRWAPTETLDALVLRIGALIQLDPMVLDAHSPANSEANDWVQQNQASIPLGKVSFRTIPPASRISWGG
jgi:ubiquitin-protein ligase